MDPDQIVAKGAALFAAHRVAELDDLDPESEQRDRPKLPGITSLEHHQRDIQGLRRQRRQGRVRQGRSHSVAHPPER